MYRLSFNNLFFLIGLASLIMACSKNEPEATNPAPVIATRSIGKFTLVTNATKARRDSVVVTISFSDGDGDLGEDARDSTRLKTIFSNQSWGNYQIRAFQFLNNKFEEITLPNSSKLFIDLGRSTVLPQTGTIAYNQLFTYTSNYRLLPVKFQIRMRDRNLNESNVVETDTISVPVSL